MTKTKTTSKEFLLTELLDEEALKPKHEVEAGLVIQRKVEKQFRLAPPIPVSETEIKKQWRAVRNFFRTAENLAPENTSAFRPVMLARLLDEEELITDYPVFLSEDNEAEHCSVSSLLKNIFQKTFKSGEAEILLRNLPRIETYIRKQVAESGNYCPFVPAFEHAVEELSKIKIRGNDGINYLNDLEKFKSNFPLQGTLLGFSKMVHLHILTHLLKHQFKKQRKSFITELHKLKSGLRDLLSVENVPKHSEEYRKPESDVAVSFIEFNTLDSLMPERASESMPQKRLTRISECIRQLSAAETLLEKHPAIIYIGKSLKENQNIRWNELLQEFDVRIAETGQCCSLVLSGFTNHIRAFSKLLSAARIAKLELTGKYDEEIHDEYFTRFDWFYFTEEETALCPPVMLIEETQNLLDKELHIFSSLIASNKPVKILAVNILQPYGMSSNGSEHDDLFSFEHELSALAVSHRGTFTLQSAVHNPLHLAKGFSAGLASPSPALFHVLVNSLMSGSAVQNFLDISAAVEGRQFPLFTYNVKGEKWGSRFDISDNPQPHRNWAEYSLGFLNDQNLTENINLDFTYADYIALNKISLKYFMVVPPSCWSDDLIPLSNYLALSSEKLYSKVPYIWLADSGYMLFKAAVPFSLVIEARERLDFWNFIQELGGVNSYHVEQAVERTRKEMQEIKEKEIKEIESKSGKKIEEVRNSAAGEAMNHLAGILLDLDSITTGPSPKIISPLPDSQSAREVKSTENVFPEIKSEEKTEEVSAEPWVDTFKCTSCNECTDKYPRAFKYNSDKQAYIDDATTVTFAQLVKAAELCPAKCIHPGMPMNPNEPGLQELIAKAKKFS